MDQEKFGKLIKKIRKDNNLTQKQLADKYNVTYQAVSKWETGKNMPDTILINQIAKDFNISLDEMFEGKITTKRKTKITTLILGIILILVIIILIILNLTKDKDFEFKTLSSSCTKFNISGSISYNKNKTAIYISNIDYCGGNDEEKYKKIECTLYEVNKNIKKEIDSCSYNKKESIKLEDFLKTITLSDDNYSRTCKNYKTNNLYLEINATDSNNKVISYKVPLKLKDSCEKY